MRRPNRYVTLVPVAVNLLDFDIAEDAGVRVQHLRVSVHKYADGVLFLRV